MKTIFAVAAALVAAGCTSIQVKPVDAAASFRQVCIVENSKVEVSDFLDVLRDGFDRHGIASSVVNLEGAKACDVTLTYTALRTWDLAPYLSHAELRLWRDGRQIGSLHPSDPCLGHVVAGSRCWRYGARYFAAILNGDSRAACRISSE